MENATKALLIAAGMLLAVMIISLLVAGYNQISAYYRQEQELLSTEQLDKFNKQFQNYNREDIRGNELISLMNKIIDYNVTQSYQEGTNYERIKVTITIGDNSIVEQFMYNKTGTKIISNVITNTSGSGSNYVKDKQLVAITNIPATLIQKAEGVGINNLTDTQLQKLTMEISNILVDDTTVGNRQNEDRRIRATTLRNILKLTVSKTSGSDIVLDDNYITTNIDGKEKIKTIKEIVTQYYQYTQFKRAYFKCTELKHNTETGRVNEMNFEVQTKEQNGQTVVQFD